MKSRALLFQCFLCAVLLTCLIAVRAKSESVVSSVAAFGEKAVQNQTLYDFCNNLCDELLYE